LPPDADWTLIDAYFPGNWMVRGYGETGPQFDLPWLSEDPLEGTVPAGECQEVAVTFDATGLTPGEYLGGLLIESNDLDEPEITIPVTMTVVEAANLESVTFVATGLQVAFDATVSGTAPFTFAWDFGDGGTANVEDPVYDYAAGGCYTVTLIVSNLCGEDTWTGQVCVCEAVDGVDFTWLPANPVAGETVSFAATVDVGTPPFTFAWDFGDGTTGTGQNVDKVYATPGDYLVELTVDNSCGQAVAAYTVTVDEPVMYFYLPVIYKVYGGVR